MRSLRFLSRHGLSVTGPAAVLGGRELGVRVFCGIDWSERHHDVALVDESGALVVKERVGDDAAGFRRLLELLAEHGAEPGVTGIAIETDQGLVVAALAGAGFTIHVINPVAVARYRDRHSPSKAKSDPGDALVLANVLRTDLDQHRPMPADSSAAQAVRVLARAQQDSVAERLRIQGRLRSTLRLFYPAALQALTDLGTAAAAEVLLVAPSPAEAARLRPSCPGPRRSAAGCGS